MRPCLDTPVVPIYSAAMCHRVIAALFVTIWLTLLGIEFIEEAGVFEFSQAGMDVSVESVLAGLGEAIKISDDHSLDAVPTPSTDGDFYLTVIRDLPLELSRENDKRPKKDLRVYKLQLTLLI